MKKVFACVVCLIGMLMFATGVSATSYSEDFQNLTKDGKLEIRAVEATDLDTARTYIELYMNEASENVKDAYFSFTFISEDDLSKINVKLLSVEDNAVLEEHEVSVSYNTDVDAGVLNDITQIANSVEEKGSFTLSDLNLINYYVAQGGSRRDVYILNYAADIKEITSNINVTYKFISRLGVASPLFEGGGGTIVLVHDGFIYALVDGGYNFDNVIYIPEGTENTQGAYMAAALKRIKDYVPEGTSVEIKYVDTLTNYSEDGASFYEELTAEYENLRDEYYEVSINDAKLNIIIATSEELVTPSHETTDAATNITITTSSSLVPLDTVVEVEEIGEGHEDYEAIKNAVDTELFVAFDLKLYSDSTNAYISKLSDSSKFEVSIPVPTKLQGKKLVVYFINDAGEIAETFEVTVSGTSAKFFTGHFSTYVLAEATETVNPDSPATSDNVMLYVGSVASSVIAFFGCAVYLKKKNAN